jgi:alpha-L-rhamnosidase
MSQQVTRDDFSDIRWRGHWIWLPEEEGGAADLMSAFGMQAPRDEAHGLFRKTFELEQVPERAPARITADSRYLLWVNGQEVYRGPVRSQPRRLRYDLFDLAPYLQPGANVIAVYVKYYGRPTAFWMPAAPNMALGKSGVLVFEADLGALGWLVSDPTWKAAPGEAWGSPGREGNAITQGVPIEVFDARRDPLGWQQVGFDDAAWEQARPVPAVHIGGFARTQPPTDPYGPLYPRTIAKLGGELKTPVAVEGVALRGAIDAQIGDPVDRVSASAELEVAGPLSSGSLPLTAEIPEDGALRLRLDMGGIVSGFVQFAVQAPAGTQLDLQYTEEPELVAPGMMVGMHCGTRYVARGHDDRFQAFDSNGFRYAHLLIHGASGSVTLEAFAVQENIYPWAEGAGFQCSDDELNALFKAGIRTVQLNSHDAFLDCPTREQRAWVGDAVVHQMVHLATNLDWRLARHNVVTGNSPRSDGILPMSVVGEMEASGSYTIPDWALHWVHAVHNLYRFEGDRELIASFMPTVERILRWYAPYQGANGLLKDVVEWNLIDWSSVHAEDTSAVINALWARGLKELGEMAAWLGQQASQRWAETRYAEVKAGFEAFWDEARGSYVDHIVDGEQHRPMSQLAGALAICADLASEARWARIVETITDPEALVVRSWTGGADGEYRMEKMMKQFQGIYEADWDVETEVVSAEPFMSYVVHDAVAKAGLADRLPDLYRRWSEFLVDGYDTIGECWGWGTHVHGWSCTPTRDMVFYTLGVQPDAPGYAVARVAPRLGMLAWAEGTVPTPHGLIRVHATADTVQIESPVPVVLDLEGQEQRELDAGSHEVSI